MERIFCDYWRIHLVRILINYKIIKFQVSGDTQFETEEFDWLTNLRNT